MGWVDLWWACTLGCGRQVAQSQSPVTGGNEADGSGEGLLEVTVTGGNLDPVKSWRRKWRLQARGGTGVALLLRISRAGASLWPTARRPTMRRGESVVQRTRADWRLTWSS